MNQVVAVLMLLINLPLWLGYELVWLLLFVVGLLIVPLCIELGHHEKSRVTQLMIYTAPRLLWLWGNDEDGYQSATVLRLLPARWGLWRTMYHWAAIRNPVNNLRFIRWLHPPQRLNGARWAKWGAFTFVWQGILGRLVYNDEKRQASEPGWFAVGWKYDPTREAATGWQQYGCGFGLRWKRKP